MNFTKDHQQQYPKQPTTGFVPIKTHQAGFVAIHRYCDLNEAGLKAYALKIQFVGKVRKTDTAKLSIAQRHKHCQLV